MAPDKVAVLPFGHLIDPWRWRVFSGESSLASYNGPWWELRRRYQSIAPPVARAEGRLRPGCEAPFDAASLIDCFRPLMGWLSEQSKNRQRGSG
jgi:hypothetical protein